MSTSYKAQVVRDVLKGDLILRMPVVAVTGGATAGFDANGDATLAIGAGTAGTQSAFIRVKGVAGFGKDILGTTQNVFTPHIIQLALETSTIASVTLMTTANVTLLLGELLKFGVRVELYLSANTVAPVVGTITGAPLAVFEPHIQYPLMASM